MDKAPKPIFAAIPDPTTDVQGLHRTVLAMKVAIEQIIGQRTGPVAEERKASIFTTSDTAPDAGDDGDLWLFKGGEQTSVSMMIGGKWTIIWP